jgi:penicillin-binding protein 1A
MSDKNNRPRQSRISKNSFTTKSGNTIKVHRSFSDRIKASRDARVRRRANRLATLPKGRVKRILYRLSPKRLAHYWFSRDGLIMALKLAGIGLIAGFVVLVGLFAYFRKDLPKITDISGDNLGGSISYYDRTGQVLLWQDYNEVKRIPVQSSDIAPYMKDATVAIEDKNFYHEGALSVTGIARAGLHDVFGGNGSLQGASTITEQVVKLNENWTGSRTISTKVKEIILAVDLERQYSKDDILTSYLNIAPYGGVDYGVQVASEDYFGVPASQLTLAQSAMLAAIPQSPTDYSPYSSPVYNSAVQSNDFNEPALIGRQQYVLDQMAKQHYITQAQADAAKKVDVLSQVKPLTNQYAGIQDPYFVLSAKQQLENTYGASTVNRGGWKVITTLNVPLQNLANSLVQKNLPNVEHDKGDEEAMAAEDVKTGQMVALVGGVDFSNPSYGQINYAETPIPPGSSFKPYDYVSLINDTNTAGAGSVLYDVQQPLPGYPCTNKAEPLQGGNCLEDYDFLYPGAETLRYALAGSRNVPAAKAMLSAVPNSQCAANVVSACVPSINKVIQTADAMMASPNAYQCYSDVQLTQPTQCYASSAFGDGAYLHLDQHVNGDATLAREGVAIPTTYILKISDANNNTIYNWTQPKGTQVVRTDAAYIVDNMLSDPNASYLPSFQKFQHYKGWDFAVKTGTTNDNFDGLMTSWSTQYAVASWVGYHTRNVALTAGQMEDLTEPLTRNWIEGASDMLNETPVNWTQPSDIKVLPAYVQSKHIDLGDVEPGPSTDLFPSWYTAPKATNTSQTIDKLSGLTATSCTPAAAKQTSTNSNDSSFSIDMFYPPGGSTVNASAASGSDNIHSCSDPPLPTPTLTVDDDTGNQAKADSSGNYICPSGCQEVVALDLSSLPQTTEGTNAYPRFPVTLNLLVNGQVTSTQSIDSPSASPTPFTYVPPSTGTVQLSVQATDNALYSSTSSTVSMEAASP